MLRHLFLLLCLVTALQSYATTRYVKPTASGTGDGSSWTNASNDLQAMIDASSSNDEIWVATGTYLPTESPDGTTGNLRIRAFHFDTNIKIYGGFSGSETSLSQRPDNSRSTLSGDIGTANDKSDNVYHVVITVGTSNTALLDGFTIQDGNSNVNPPVSVTYSGTTINSFEGGGIYTHSSSIIIQNCIIRDNDAGNGAGLTNSSSTGLSIINCVFVDNDVTSTGGAVFNNGAFSPSSFINCVFYSNTSLAQGGAMYNAAISNIVNCTFANNTSQSEGGGVFNSFNSTNIYNTVFYGNNGSTNDDIGGIQNISASSSNNASDGTGLNISSGSGFVSLSSTPFENVNNGDGVDNIWGTDDDGVSISAASPLFGLGDDAQNSQSTDVAGQTRKTGTIDIGAYEYDALPCQAASRLFVNINASGANTGESWLNAFTDLQDALDCATTDDEIWVATGTYKPTDVANGVSNGPNDRHHTFHQTNDDIKIYGGFSGTETMLSQRDPKINLTVLSGDIGTANDNSDNCYHVFLFSNLTNTTILDGFTIQDGNADGSGSTLAINNNDGGGVANYVSLVTISNCIFQNNQASSDGGAIMNQSGSDATIINCIFTNNQAGSVGGAINNSSSGGSYTNCVFYNNSATTSGGGMMSSSGGAGNTPTLVNCTFVNNTASNHGAINTSFSTFTIHNTVFYGNTPSSGGLKPSVNSSSSYNASDIIFTSGNALSSGTGYVSLASSPFINLNDADGADNVWATDDDGLTIGLSSALYNVGNNTFNAEASDVKDELRIVNTTIDIGAYEYYVSPCVAATILYVNHAASGNNTGESWANAFTNLQDALDCADAGEEIWVAAGTYTPNTTPDGTTGSSVNDRNNAYHLNGKDLKIYGGFSGTETMLSQRNSKTNATVLSGDIGVANTNTDNCYHIFITKDLTNSTIIDGFTFTKGKADGGSSITYDGQTIQQNNAGAIYNNASHPTISNCIFTDNSSSDEGGAMVNAVSAPILLNCIFYNNSSSTRGGAIFSVIGIPKFTQCIFANNNAQDGGAVYNDGAGTNIINCIFTKNTATSTGGAMANNATPVPLLHNTVFYDNKVSTTISDIAGNIDATSSHNASDGTGGSINSGTGFVALTISPFDNDSDLDGADNVWATADDGLKHHVFNSLLIDVGDNTKNSETTDIAGDNRKQNTIDIGAYETVASPCKAATVLYVDESATGNNTGESWANAFTDLQDAIDCADASEEIWVASGSYIPKDAPDGTISTGNNDRSNAFHWSSKDLKIYGGFAGTETMLSQRDPASNLTILSANVGSFYSASDNVYHILITRNLTSSSILDGFTIQAGQADGTETLDFEGENIVENNGAAMINLSSALTITDCIFKNNNATGFGGAMHNSNSALTMNNCEMFNNNATSDGGAIYNDISDMTMNSCIISINTAGGNSGAVHNNLTTNATFKNVMFHGNVADVSGGAVSNFSATTHFTQCVFNQNVATNGSGGGVDNTNSMSNTFTNCTFTKNIATSAGGLYNNLSFGTILHNTVFYDNVASGNPSDLAGDNIDAASVNNASDGTGANINAGTGFVALTASPFVNIGNVKGSDNTFLTADDGLTPVGLSAIYNTGDDTKNSETLDIKGETRKEGTIDIGAYEAVPPPCKAATRLYVNHAAPGNNTGESWANAFTLLQDALDCADAGEEIWVAKGTYFPSDAPDGTTSNGHADRNNAFHIENKDVEIYGGFDGTETMLSERNIITNETILSGDYSADDLSTGSGSSFAISNNSENAYHVFVNVGLTNTAVLDGFTIKGGNANGGSSISYAGANILQNKGGGIATFSSAPTLSNLKVQYNSGIQGGGLELHGASGSTYSPVLDKMSINFNIATNTGASGGGLFIEANSSPTISNTAFDSNKAAGQGGAIYNDANGAIAIKNVVFNSNTAASNGGGFYNTNNTDIFNVIFHNNNSDAQGGGIYHSAGTLNLFNTAFFENMANGSVSDIEGNNIDASSSHNASDETGGNISTGTGFVNLTESPFVNEEDPNGVDDEWLTVDDGLFPATCANETLINAGTTTNPTLTTDAVGQSRVGDYDIGAYEYQDAASVPNASADIPSGDASTSATQGSNTSFATDCNTLIALVEQTGDNQVSGNVDANVWVATSVPTYLGKPYLQRHYQITPQNNPSTVTGKVTLFFTQGEFDTYNADPNVQDDLPTGPNDAAGKANLRISKFDGTSSDGSGLPGTYSGNIVIIDPDDDKIIWVTGKMRWEVTFEVTGFSGFFANSQSNNLPVELTFFKGEITESGNQLIWQTASEKNNKGFDIERSIDGRNWQNIGFVAGQGDALQTMNYEYLDANATNNIHYYRLKQLDFDGGFDYSNVITLGAGQVDLPVNIFPNPVRDVLNIENAEGFVTIYNALGQVVQTFEINSSQFKWNVSSLERGTYHIRIQKNNGDYLVKSFVK